MAHEREGLLPPLYQQVADDLRARIGGGMYPVGTRLPTKPKLLEHYGVALGTLDKAIDILREAGLVETRQGSGMYVREVVQKRTEHDELRDQVSALQQEVTELRQRLGRLEANLVSLSGHVGHKYPRGGSRERAKAADGGKRQG